MTERFLLWCMFQAGSPSLHYYCTVVLHSCIVLPPVGHSSNHQYKCCQLTKQSTVFRIFITLLRFSFDSPLYIAISLTRSLLSCGNWNILANGKIYNAGQVSNCTSTPYTTERNCMKLFVLRPLLGAFAIAKSDDLASSSVCTEQLGTHGTDFHEILYLGIFFLRKSIEKIQVS